MIVKVSKTVLFAKVYVRGKRNMLYLGELMRAFRKISHCEGLYACVRTPNWVKSAQVMVFHLISPLIAHEILEILGSFLGQ